MKPPFEPLREVGLKWLRMKTLFLVAITSVRRVSELNALSVKSSCCTFHKDKVVLLTDPTFRPKVDSSFHRSQEICLPTFCPQPQHPKERLWHTLDVKRALKIYIAWTEPWRKSDSLFIGISPPRKGEKLAKSSISAILKTCIVEAYRAVGTGSSKWHYRTLSEKCSNQCGTDEQSICGGSMQGCNVVIHIYLHKTLQDSHHGFCGGSLWEKSSSACNFPGGG